MPLIRYRCTVCDHSFTSFQGQNVAESIPCKKCQSIAKRTLSAPSSTSKIVIDDGQARAVEVHPDVIEFRKERKKPVNRGD